LSSNSGSKVPIEPKLIGSREQHNGVWTCTNQEVIRQDAKWWTSQLDHHLSLLDLTDVKDVYYMAERAIVLARLVGTTVALMEHCMDGIDALLGTEDGLSNADQEACKEACIKSYDNAVKHMNAIHGKAVKSRN
jgi:hypothetical protein